MNNFDYMWDFDILNGVDFPHCNRVHPLMQRRIQMILNKLKEDSNIKTVVLFGSSLEFRCSSYSDIDLYIEKYDHEKKVESDWDIDCEVDLLMDLDHSSNLYREIDKKGLLLFERK